MALPAEMRQIVMDGAGPPEVMKLSTGPVPTPRPDEVLIKVLAAGVNIGHTLPFLIAAVALLGVSVRSSSDRPQQHHDAVH